MPKLSNESCKAIFHPTKTFPLPTPIILPTGTFSLYFHKLNLLFSARFSAFSSGSFRLGVGFFRPTPSTPLRAPAQHCSSSRGSDSAPISDAPRPLAQPILGHVRGCVCVSPSVPPGTGLTHRERSANFCSSIISSFWPCLEIQWSTPCWR